MNTLSEKPTRMHLENIAFYGRTFEEYCSIFKLEPSELSELRILDTASGSASFAAEAAQRGIDITATDPLYDRSATALGRIGAMDIENVIARARQTESVFTYSYYKSMDEVYQARYRAMRGFIEDYPSGRALGRYQSATLPHLPFSDGAFDLVLNGHFLFLYAERLGDAFVFNAVSELLRVSRRSVFLYPLIQLNGERYPLMDELVKKLDFEGVSSEFRPLDFEFFKGANQCLKLRKT
ncbi:MAG: hypothetical protein AAF212_00495 [Verrucomicrobiota bacterium]